MQLTASTSTTRRFLGWAGTYCICLVGVSTALLISLGKERWAMVLVPVLVGGFGLLLVETSPVAYLSLVWWVWMLSPEVRRIVEGPLGYHAQDPISLSPYVVTAISALSMYRRWQQNPRVVRAVNLMLFGIGWAFVVGSAHYGFKAALYDLFAWSTPVLLAGYLAVHWRLSRELALLAVRLAVTAALVVGIYGIYQYLALPSWDATWMRGSGLASIGLPVARHVRVFSTLNSPGPMAVTLMIALLMLLRARPLQRIVAAIPALATFGLSLVRSAWGGWLVGVAYVLAFGGGKRQRSRLALTGLLVVAALVITTGPFARVVDRRVGETVNITQDTSFRARVDFYRSFGTHAFGDPLGHGLGSTGVATELDTGSVSGFGSFDSGLLDLGYVLGWPGLALYAVGALRLARRAQRSGRDPLSTVLNAALLAGVVQLLFTNVLTGVTGIGLALCLGLLLASAKSARALGYPYPDGASLEETAS